MTPNEEEAYVLLTRCSAMLLQMGAVIGSSNDICYWTADMTNEFGEILTEIEKLQEKMV